jgi:3-hydroxy acid dehydrogenase/malonic semialdehyde reductase
MMSVSVPYLPQHVLITGATSDIGRAIARRFADLGCRLTLHGRSPDKLALLQQEINGAETICFDLNDKSAMAAALATLKDVDLLVNNAGGALGLDAFDQTPLADITTMIEANVTSLVAVTHYLLPPMIAARRGHIINLGSVAGSWPYPGGHIYCASKAFVQQFSRALRSDLAKSNVRVTNIEPGMVETSFSLKRFKGDGDRAASVYANTTPLTADDVAETVVWSACLPPHININTIEVMPTSQSFGPLQVHREGA